MLLTIPSLRIWLIEARYRNCRAEQLELDERRGCNFQERRGSTGPKNKPRQRKEDMPHCDTSCKFYWITWKKSLASWYWVCLSLPWAGPLPMYNNVLVDDTPFLSIGASQLYLSRELHARLPGVSIFPTLTYLKIYPLTLPTLIHYSEHLPTIIPAQLHRP